VGSRTEPDLYGVHRGRGSRTSGLAPDVTATISDRWVVQLGTFNGNPLTTAALRATLCDVLTGQAYAHFDALAKELTA
jgi:glutamate-1-semialdehyde 2,1-aminomutase